MKYPQTFPFYFSERWWDELSVLAAVLPMRSDIKILIAALAGVWDRNMVLTLPPPTPAIHISDHGFFHQTDHRRARYQTFILYGEGGRHTMRSKLHTMRTERVKQPVSYFCQLYENEWSVECSLSRFGLRVYPGLLSALWRVKSAVGSAHEMSPGCPGDLRPAPSLAVACP